MAVVFALANACSAMKATIPYQPKHVDPFQMRWTWSEIEGLAAPGNLRCFEVGNDGTLWLGYEEGVVSFDGFEQTAYPEVRSRGQRSILAASDGCIYVTGWNRVWRFDGKKWFRYQKVLTMPSPSDVGVLEDPSGRLWIAANSRLAQLGSEDFRFSREVAKNPISDFAIDAAGDFWLVESPSGTIRQLRYENKQFREIDSWEGLMAASKDGENATTDHAVHALFVASDQSVWVANAHREVPPHQLRPGTREWIPHDLEAIGGTHLNGDVSETSDGVVRITGSGLIHSYDGSRWRSVHENRLSGSRSWAYIKEGKDGKAWLLERFVSLSRIDYRGEKWTKYEGLTFQARSCDGLLWFLAEGNRIVSSGADGKNWRSHENEQDMIETVAGIVARSDGSLWALGCEKGMAAASIWNGTSWSKHLFPSLGSTLLAELAVEDLEGTLFLGGRPSSTRGMDPREHFVALIPSGKQLPNRTVRVEGRILQRMKALPDGRVALASDDLFAWDGQAFKSLLGEARESLYFKDITGFSIGPSGEIWVSSWKLGIALLDQAQWRYFGETEGLSSGYVADMIRGLDGHPVALTHRGLTRFDGQQWHSINTAQSEGLPAHSNLKMLEDGSIWLSLDERLEKRSRAPVGAAPNPTLQSIRYVPSKDPPDTKISLVSKPDQHSRSLWVSWTGVDPWFETPTADLLYSYRIDNGTWSLFSKEKGELLTDLKVGHRQIEVRSLDKDGNIDPTPAVSRVEILMPFWETGWFTAAIVAIATAMLAMLGGLLLQRIRHLATIDRIRSRFLTNISHELRSPLTLVLAPLEKMAARIDPKSSDASEVALALRNAARLQQLIDQLLELRKMESNSTSLKLESCDLVRYLEQTVDDLDRIAQTAGQRVNFKANVKEAWIELDKDVIRKIVDNLVLNALKHSPEGSATDVFLDVADLNRGNHRNVEIRVQDEGTGIAPDSLPHIFEAFYSGKAGSFLKMRSFGIGLALVKELVESLDGTVEALSPLKASAKNGGTRFTVRLPRLAARPLPGSNQQDQATVISRNASPETVDAKPILLLVEDQKDILRFLSDELSSEFDILEAQDCEEALSLATREVPDIILTDIMMHGASGIDLCNAIRDTEITRHIPIVIQTAFSESDFLGKALQSGAVDFLQKPFSIEALRRKLLNLVRSRREFAKQMRIQLMAEPQEECAHSDQVLIDRIRGLIELNLSNLEFSAHALAKELGLSRTSFYRKCKAVFDMSPSELIKSYRLERSVALLAEGKTASETCYLVGYSEPSAFHRAFKRRYGHTPSDYKETLTKQNHSPKALIEQS